MAHGFQHKLDSVRDSIASLFKRRKNGGGWSKNESRISTPQNVKRVMHITFDPGNQSFEGIPANWRGYFEGQQASNPSSAEAQEASRLPVKDEYAAVCRVASRKLHEHVSTPAQHAATGDEYDEIKAPRAKTSFEVPPKMAGLAVRHTTEDHRGWQHAEEGLAAREHHMQDCTSWPNSNSQLQSRESGNLLLEESQKNVKPEATDHLADGHSQNAAGAHPSDGTEHSEQNTMHSAYDKTENSEQNTTHSAYDKTENSEQNTTHSAYDRTEHSKEHFTRVANSTVEASERQHATDPQAVYASRQEEPILALDDLTLAKPASGEGAVPDDHSALGVEPRRAHLSAFGNTGGASADTSGRTESQALRAPRELLSLVYDRDNGRFVNLPPHWEERLVRNNLLEPEFQTNPRLLALVFGMMDQELRTMRAEGERVESCMYTSTLPARSQSRLRENRPYVFRIEADKSNSSSEVDLLSDQQLQEHPAVAQMSAPKIDAQLVEGSRQRKLQRGHSFVVIKAVEVPDELDEE